MNQRVCRFSNFLGEAPRPPAGVGAHVGASLPPVPLSDGLDTRPCQILGPPLSLTLRIAGEAICSRYGPCNVFSLHQGSDGVIGGYGSPQLDEMARLLLGESYSVTEN